MRVFLATVATALAALVATPMPAAAQSSTAPQRGLRAALSHDIKAAGGASGALVTDMSSGRTLYSAAASTPRLPASVEKLYTTSTALLQFGSSATLTTRILGTGTLDARGHWHGTLYLKGGGDPTFGSSSFDHYAYGSGATMQRLVANLIQQTGITAVYGRIVGDETYFDSLRGTPATGFQVSSYVEGVLSALAYDRGLADEQGNSFQTKPPLFAAQRLVDALRAAGITVPRGTSVAAGRAPTSARVLTGVHSPRMATLTRLTNSPSDNFFAEILLKDIGARSANPGSTSAGVAVVRGQLARSFGIHPRFDDGSGLSRYDRTSPRDVVTTLQSMAGNRALFNSLSVAGESGTLQAGLRGTPAQGRCRGKTGSLHDVANLVGYCTARDGHLLAFAFLMNAVDPTAGHALEDHMAVTLARYND